MFTLFVTVSRAVSKQPAAARVIPEDRKTDIMQQALKKLSDDDGIVITLKTDHDKAGLDDFCGCCHGASGCAANASTKSDIDKAGTFMDMDAATGYKRAPGSAGAHPIMQRARTPEDYTFMAKQAGSLVPKLVQPKKWAASRAVDTD